MFFERNGKQYLDVSKLTRCPDQMAIKSNIWEIKSVDGNKYELCCTKIHEHNNICCGLDNYLCTLIINEDLTCSLERWHHIIEE